MSVQLHIMSLCDLGPFFLGWHVLGLLYRNDKNYEEAQKCYKTALRFDPQNGQILRDLAILQVQTANYTGHLESRLVLLRMNPQVKSSWVALVIAYHLVEDFDEALKTLGQYLDHVSEATGVLRHTVFDSEMAELHLYKAMIMEEAGKFQACLDSLRALDFRGGDVLKVRSVIARMLLKTGAKEEALKAYKDLLRLVPDNLEYLKGIQSCKDIDMKDETAIAKFVDELKAEFPRSGLVKSFYLKQLSGESFEAAFKNYALPLLKKGAPSVFHSVSGLYEQEHHRASIRTVVDGLKQTFENLEDKKAHFWCLYFLAQHHDRLGKPLEALSCLDTAYELDAEVPDLFLMYGRVLKHSNMINKAVECMEHARKMDLGDRFLNSKAVKYLLRAGELKRAQETIALFLKAGELEKQMSDLAEIQAIWFDLEAGKCLMAKGDFEGAKTYFGRVTKLYEEFHDDQLDFHNYALRKMTLTYYLELLRYERSVYSEPCFREAAELFIECCKRSSQPTAEKTLEEAMGSLNINVAEQDRIELLQERLEKFPSRVFGHVSRSRPVRTLTVEDLASSKFLSSLQ